MNTTVRTHPWWVAGLAALAALATVCVLALAGAFDGNEPIVVESPPVVVVKPTTGGINQANALRQERQLQHGVVITSTSVTGDTKSDLSVTAPAATGDTKDDLGAVSPAAGRYLAVSPAGAGH